MVGHDADIAILGGGLAGGLSALALAGLRPDLRVMLIEGEARCGGNHVWSFFETDIDEADRWLIEPLIVKSWKRHEVRFNRLTRTLGVPYHSITGETLDAVLRATLPEGAILCGARVEHVAAQSVTLADGRRVSAGVVIDARGGAGCPGLVGGWQKFVGRHIHTGGPHGYTQPIIMDARVPQRDGYRFVYILPFGVDELFVEETYYSLSPTIDHAALTRRIEDFCQLSRFPKVEVLNEEMGILPVVSGGDYDRFAAAGRVAGVARIGARAGLFHPLTSYSLPIAVETAMLIARTGDFTPTGLERLCADHARAHWRRTAYARFLARLMFGAGRPGQWVRVFRHFYTKPVGLITRFYAGRLGLVDKVRLLVGRPPVPVLRAIATILGGGARPSSLADAPVLPIPVPTGQAAGEVEVS